MSLSPFGTSRINVGSGGIPAGWGGGDPARQVGGIPPDPDITGRNALPLPRIDRPDPTKLGLVLPHYQTFAAIWNSLSQVYRTWQDEAQRRSLEDSLAMRRDAFLQELLERRWMPVSELPFNLIPDDPLDPEQKQICEELTRIVEAIPNFQTLKINLLEAIWFGKAIVQCDYQWTTVNGKQRTSVVYHEPIMGDKIVWKWGGVPGILCHATFDPGPANRENVQLTDRGRALFLFDPWYRSRFVVHRYRPTDVDWLYEPEQAAAVQGYGVRARIAWVDFLRRQLLGWMFDGLQRVQTNGMLYALYPSGDGAARDEVLQALQDIMRDNVAAYPADEQMLKFGNGEWIKHVDTTTIAYDVLKMMIDWAEGIITRLVVGQNMNTAEGAGLQAVGQFRENTFAQIVRFDANSLGETLTNDLLSTLIRYNHWNYRGRHYYLQDLPFAIRMKLQTERPDIKDRIEAAARLISLGIDIDLEDVRDAAGFTKSRDESTSLGARALMQQENAGQAMARGASANGNGNGHGRELGANGLPKIPPLPGTTRGGATENAKLPPLPSLPDVPEAGESETIRHQRAPVRTSPSAAARDTRRPRSPARAKAGNYRKGRFRWRTSIVAIETPKGATRSGVGKGGKPWSTVMKAHYGHVLGSGSADGDPLDVFVGPRPRTATHVYVIDQVDPDTGRFDEHKCMLGYESEKDARRGYLENYEKGWKGLGAITAIPVAAFEPWARHAACGEPIGELVRHARVQHEEHPCGDGGPIQGFHDRNVCAELPGGSAHGRSGSARPEQEKVTQPASAGEAAKEAKEFAEAHHPETIDAAQQYKQMGVRSPAFKNWFGDWENDPKNASKVVDPKTGAPKEQAPLAPQKFFHGTRKAFDAFSKTNDIGFHFGTKEQAQARLKKTARSQWSAEGQVMEVYLNIRNPIRLSDGHWEYPEDMAEVLDEHDLMSPEVADIVEDYEQAERAERMAANDYASTDVRGSLHEETERLKRRALDAIRDAFKDAGYDGVVYGNEIEGEGDSWIAFDAHQIKAVDNAGTFDPQDKRFRHESVVVRHAAPSRLLIRAMRAAGRVA